MNEIKLKKEDLSALIINADVRAWWKKRVEPVDGYIWDYERPERDPSKDYRYFLRILLALDQETRTEYLEFSRKIDKRAEYLDAWRNKRGINADRDVPDEQTDAAFFDNWFARCKEDETTYRRKFAAVHFAFDRELYDWFCNVWLGDEPWSYNSKRDDASLLKILSDVRLRVKAPDILERVFNDFILPFLGSAAFLTARKKYRYMPEDYFGDVYQRLFGRFRREKADAPDCERRIEYWNEKKSFSLGEWLEVEAMREIWRVLKRRRVSKPPVFYPGELLNVYGAFDPDFDGNKTTLDAQTLFDDFFKSYSLDAYTISAYFSSPFTYKEIAPVFGFSAENMSQRTRRAVERWRDFCERTLRVPIDKELFKKMLKSIKPGEKTEGETTEQEEASEKKPRLGCDPKKDWRKNIGRLAVKPTENDKMLLKSLLKSRRVDETGFYEMFRFDATFPQNQGGFGFKIDPEMWIDPTWKERAQEKNRVLTLFRPAPYEQRHWRNKYSASNSVAFYFESTEKPDSDSFWTAMVRVPLDATDDDEIGVCVDDYRGTFVCLGEFRFNETTKAPIKYGVAKFSVRDFRAGIEQCALGATVKIRYYSPREQRLKGRVDAEFDSPGRLLFRKDFDIR